MEDLCKASWKIWILLLLLLRIIDLWCVSFRLLHGSQQTCHSKRGLCNSMKLWAMAVQGHPRQTGHSESIWQHVVHWEEYGNLHSSVLAWRTLWIVWKGKKIWLWKMTTTAWPRHPGQKVFSTSRKRREIANRSSKNEAAGSKQEWCSTVDVSDGKS